MGKYTFEDWKNKEVVLKFERRDFVLDNNIPVVDYNDFSTDIINKIKQEKEDIFLKYCNKLFISFLSKYKLRKQNSNKNLSQFNHHELVEIDNYLFGVVPHKKVKDDGVYSIKNQRQCQVFCEIYFKTNFKGMNFEFVGIDYSINTFCYECFVFALWKLRTEIKNEMEFKFERRNFVFQNWEAYYLFLSVESSFEQKGELKKSDYDFIFYKLKQEKAIKGSTSQFEYVQFLELHNPNIKFTRLAD